MYLKFLIYKFLYLILLFICVIISGFFTLSLMSLFGDNKHFFIIAPVILLIISIQTIMYFNLDKTDKIFWVGEFEKIIYCFSFFLSANLFLRVFFRNAFYKKENFVINKKNHILKTNIFNEKFFFYKNKIHREDYKPSVLSKNINYWKEDVYVHGNKIKDFPLTSNELIKYKNKNKILNF